MDGLSKTYIKGLVDEAAGCFGGLAEAKAKCAVLKKRLFLAKRGRLGEPLDRESFRRSVVQMRRDVAKYSERINEIHEELQSYGVIPHLV